MLGGEAPDNFSCRPGDVDDQTGWRRIPAGVGWVAAGWPQLRERWQCWHRVLVAGGRGDGEFIGGAAVGPAPIFFALVASSAQPSSVIPAGGTALSTLR